MSMEVICKPFCAQISAVKFISDPQDTQALFAVGTFQEPTNSLSLIGHGGNYTEPTELAKIPHQSDVMDIQYNKYHDRILTAGSNGSLNIFNVTSDMKLDLDVGWDRVCSSCINGALFCDDRIVVVSEDCSILGIHLDRNMGDPREIFDFRIRDSAAVSAVEQIDQNTFLTANAFGQVKLWDRRIKLLNDRAQWTNLRRGESGAVYCLSRHPAQPNVVASGSSGCVCLWDLRGAEGSGPVQLNTALAAGSSSGVAWQTRFHPTRPQHLLVATSRGGLIDISGRSAAFDWRDFGNSGLAALQMRSVFDGGASGGVSMTALDVNETLAVAATDKEMLCVVPIGELCCV